MNKNKILIIPDIHYIADRDKQFKQLDFLLEFVNSYSNVIFLGDFLHYKQNALTPKYQHVFEYFLSNIKLTTNFYGVIGNHDITIGAKNNNQYLHSWFYFVSQALNKPNIHIFPFIKEKTILGKSFIFLPYSTNFIDIDRVFSKHDILITHNSTEYFFQKFGIKGDGFSKEETDKLKSLYSLIIAGHIHMKWNYENFYHIGYVFPVNYTFSPEHNFLAELDLDTLSLTYIDLHEYNKGLYKYYYMVDYDYYLKNKQTLTESTDYIRVTVPNMSIYNQIDIEDLNSHNISFRVKLDKQPQQDIVNTEKKDNIEVINLESILENYIETNYEQESEQFKQKIINTGKDLLKSAKERKEIDANAEG